MGRPVEITDEMILNAGQILSAAAKRVTGYSLRKHLGAGDTKRLEQVWLAHLEATAPAAAAPAPQTPLPQPLEAQREAASTRIVEVLTDLFANAWATADELAQATVAAEQATAREKVADADQRLADADDCITQAEMTAQQEADRADAAEALLDRARGELATAADRRAALETVGRTAADQAASTIADLRVRLAASEAATDLAHRQAAAAEEKATAAQAGADRTRSELETLRGQQFESLQSAVGDLRRRLDKEAVPEPA